MVDPESDVGQEFEAVWAVVRRLEARIRRLESTVTALQEELALVHASAADHPAGMIPEPDVALEEDSPTIGSVGSDEVTTGDEGAGAYRIIFDGGSLGNPGKGYGSYRLTNAQGRSLQKRLDYSQNGERITNNQAEYLTLIAALQHLSEALGERAPAATVEIRGDSQLVVNQIAGRWKVKNAELQPLHQRARALLASFGQADLRWHERANSVKVLGH